MTLKKSDISDVSEFVDLLSTGRDQKRRKEEMKIIIKESNRERLQKALDAVQQRTRTRTISVDNLFEMIITIDYKLDIAETMMIGIIADVDYNAQQFANAYKYVPKSTHVTIAKVASGWALTNVRRDICRGPGSKYILTLTDEAKTALVESRMRFRN